MKIGRQEDRGRGIQDNNIIIGKKDKRAGGQENERTGRQEDRRKEGKEE